MLSVVFLAVDVFSPPNSAGIFFEVVEYMYSMWLGNLVFVPFVLLGVSDDLFTLSSGKIKAGKSVVMVTTETRGHWMSINRCLSPKKKSVVLSVPLKTDMYYFSSNPIKVELCNSGL